MNTTLVNPSTGEILRLSPARPPREGTQEHNVWRSLGRSGIPKPLVSALLAAYGWPRESLGEGSFAYVVMDPTDERRVIKFTYDEMDGTTAAYVKERQKSGALDGLVKIHSVLFMPFTSTEHGGDERIWVIRAKRVKMLKERAYEDDDDAYKWRLVGQQINNAFYEYLDHTQKELLWFMQETGMRGYSKVPPVLRAKMLKALKNFAWKLGRQTEQKDIGIFVQSALRSVNQLLEERLPITDLAPRNWGIIDEESMVITDFGLSSLTNTALQKAEAATGTVVPPAPRRRARVAEGQLTLFNPLPFKVAWKVGHQWNANAFSSLRDAKEFFERVRHWPGSSHHQIVDARSGVVLVAANPVPPPARTATSRRGWWVTPEGTLVEVGPEGHVDFLVENLKHFGFTPKEIKNEELGSEWCLEVAMRRGAIRLMGGPGHGGRWEWGVEIFRIDPVGHRRVLAALAEAGAKPGEKVWVYDWTHTKEVALRMA